MKEEALWQKKQAYCVFNKNKSQQKMQLRHVKNANKMYDHITWPALLCAFIWRRRGLDLAPAFEGMFWPID